jgi:hypothetical protein
MIDGPKGFDALKLGIESMDNHRDVEGIKVNVPMLSCEVYNYSRIKEVVKDRKNIKVLHFKGFRHNKKTFKKLLLDLDI